MFDDLFEPLLCLTLFSTLKSSLCHFWTNITSLTILLSSLKKLVKFHSIKGFTSLEFGLMVISNWKKEMKMSVLKRKLISKKIKQIKEILTKHFFQMLLQFSVINISQNCFKLWNLHFSENLAKLLCSDIWLEG